MNIDINKLLILESQLSAEKGDFIFFGLLLPEEAPNRWDLVVSADWIDADKYAAMRAVADKVKQILTEDEAINLSRIVPLQTSHEGLADVFKYFTTKQQPLEFFNREIFNIRMNQGFIITADSSALHGHTSTV